MNLSEGTSPSSSYDVGSRSTPNNLPKAATRTRKKKTSDSEDEDYVAVEDEATSRKKVLKKEYKYVPPPVESDEKPDEDGITDSMLEFSWDRDVEPTVRVLCGVCVCVDVAD